MVIPQQSRGKKRFFWDLVLNNYTNEECEIVKVRIPDICDAYVISKEVGEQGTPHLQAAIKLSKGNYKSYILNHFKGTGLEKRLSLREGRNITAMRNYCMGLNADGTAKKTPSEIWIQHNVEKIRLVNKQEEFNKWMKHKTNHKRLFKDDKVSINELISNWEYYKKRSEDLAKEIDSCEWCTNDENNYDDEGIPILSDLNIY